ncbi:ECF RNA polymerase sigma factor SigK [Micromonospora endolithica]|uniref:Sigma-70 family RNA polymerase sigma factor n=1 Tax=Micromonospora endolithica TaxID=230091 RepID=A0A3A9YTM2_9ACTN|nr:ECF RNA polymerase sigma factor SigK [Micromonospora endolithica]RKN38627.1 sigma-70 family RNA polymerase sigma factor [Micromonospora endolithica]TWJ25234.1 RNA polymerase sigma-70 factor (ECF subfamily) [Micromonospora endolithica]
MSGDGEQARRLRSVPSGAAGRPDADELLHRVARGDEAAFAALYDAVAGRVLGLARRVVRDPALAEEVTQEVLVEVWRTAGRFEPRRGSASAWILTMTHRRAVDRVRAEQAHTDRMQRAAARDSHVSYDEVQEEVAARLEREQVRRCLGRLTPVQREAVTLAYYGGHTYREVAEHLATPLPTVKTRMRDGLIRMRDCLGVSLEAGA